MTSVSNSQVAKSFRANRPKSVQWLGRFVLSSLGWKVTGSIKEEHKNQKIVIVVAPHTSNRDGILGMAALAGLDARLSFFGKHTIFRYFGLGAFLKYMGGIPVNRANPEALKNEIYNVTEKYKGFIIAIAPEGTRKKVERLKSGFLRIANETNSKIMMAGIDFSNKTIELGDFFSPSGDVEQDLQFITEYFSNFAGKRPELS